MLTRGGAPLPTKPCWRHRLERGHRLPRVTRGTRRHRLPARQRRGGPAPRRSSSIGTATIWSCRRCRRGWIACCQRHHAGGSSMSPRRPGASSRATIRRFARSKDYRTEGRGYVWRPYRRRCAVHERASRTPSTRGAGRKRGCSWISGRTGGGSPLRTRPDARLLQLQRRFRPRLASKCESVEALDVSADAVERIHANAGAIASAT